MTGRFSRVAGIDFSGAILAGKGIWIAEGTPDSRHLNIDSLTRADALPGGEKARAPALAALGRRLAGQPGLLAGCDFPFSLPKPLLDGLSWRDWLTHSMAAFPDADAFRAACRAATANREWRRATDREALTPFSPYNLRLYRQSYWGMKGLLAPLITDGKAVVLPMMKDVPDLPALIEICPASVLKRWDGVQGNVRYKGRTPVELSRRTAIADRLIAVGVRLDRKFQEQAIEDTGGDALDALLGAYATWRVWCGPGCLIPRLGSDDALEGRVYF